MKGRRLQNTLTALVALLATGVQAQGMWQFFGDVLHIHNLWMRAGMFAFIEACLLVSALRARRHRLDGGGFGIDDAAVWALAALGGVLASSDAGDIRAAALRLAAPLVAAFMFERAISTERNDRAGGRTRINWRVTPERVAVWLRLAEPGARGVVEVDRARRVAAMTVAAHRLHSGAWLRRRYAARLRRLALAADDGMVAEVRRRVDRVHQIEALTAPGQTGGQVLRADAGQVLDLSATGQADSRADLPAEPVAGPTVAVLPRTATGSGQGHAEQRADADVLEAHGQTLVEILRTAGKLSRYKVEQVCGVGGRQAERVRAAVVDQAAQGPVNGARVHIPE